MVHDLARTQDPRHLREQQMELLARLMTDDAATATLPLLFCTTPFVTAKRKGTVKKPGLETRSGNIDRLEAR